MRTAIINGTLVLDDTLLPGQCLILENGIISAITEHLPPGIDHVVDANGQYVSPGFVDMHVHGGGGYDFMDGTVQAFIGAARFHLSHGTTLIQPTTVTCSDEELYRVFSAFEGALNALWPMPIMHGLHLEGPWFSAAQAGAQDTHLLRNPETAHVQAILDRCHHITRVSAACELPGGLELGDLLCQRGILAAIGHSDAEYDDVCSALSHGYSHITHLYSGMSSLRRRNAKRYLGVTECAYLMDGLSVEIIADGIHLPPELLRLILKCKPMDQISLVTDALRGAGLPNGSSFKMGSLTHGQDAIIQDGVAYMPDFSCFAGSVSTADHCIRTIWKQCGTTLPQAVSMMTRNPCRVLKLDHRKGRLAAGYDADLCLFDENVSISTVFVGGRMVK